MILIEKMLTRGHATPEEALAPLRTALPWMKNVRGNINALRSKLVFQYGEGRGRVFYPILIVVEKETDGFAITLQVGCLSVYEMISLILLPLMFLLAVGYNSLEGLLYSLPVVLLFVGIRFSYVWRHADEAMRAFSLPYGA